MKRLLVLLSLFVLLAACGGEEVPADLTALQVAQAILESQVETDGLDSFEGEALTAYLQAMGLETWEEGAVYAADGMDGREVAVLLLPREADVEAAAQALEEHRKDREGDFFGYAPAEAALVGAGRVLTQGRYAALVVCPDQAGAEAAFIACFQAGEGPSGGTTEPAPTLDVSSFVPFDPPNDFDMTLYDTSAILTAWESGEESGLSQKDAAILDRCKQIFEKVITEDMTDFEKELALHDWLVAHCKYDESTHDRETPEGRADNTNPYGVLAKNYGICLGYATTFQLFMDLAEVECITVVGAAFDSRDDHAWNMVKLDGKWYCVDVTWDDPLWNSDMAAKAVWDRVHHEYFNITSEEMRESNHQWDYENVPEATATHYRWDGVSALPTE